MECFLLKNKTNRPNNTVFNRTLQLICKVVCKYVTCREGRGVERREVTPRVYIFLRIAYVQLCLNLYVCYYCLFV